MLEQHDALSVKTADEPLATLLLADSNTDDLRTLAANLIQVGYRVIKVIDGQQLLSIIGTLNPDVILVDSHLVYNLQADYSTTSINYLSEHGAKGASQPTVQTLNPSDHFDGFVLCRMLSQEIESMYIPVILLGVAHDLEARIHSLQSNAWYYVTKPAEITELHLQLQNVLARVNNQRSLQEQSRQLKELSMHCSDELKSERAKRRRNEERISRLLETVQLQNQQLQLLTKMTMQQPSDGSTNITAQQILFDEQVQVLQQYLDQLTTLTLTFQEESNPQTISLLRSQIESTWRIMPKVNGESRIANSQQHRLPRRSHLSLADQHRPRSPLSQLSEREYEVMLQLVEGKSYQEIAEEFRISPSTVRSYRSRIMQKLGLANSTEMIKLAVRYGLISIR